MALPSWPLGLGTETCTVGELLEALRAAGRERPTSGKFGEHGETSGKSLRFQGFGSVFGTCVIKPSAKHRSLLPGLLLRLRDLKRQLQVARHMFVCGKNTTLMSLLSELGSQSALQHFRPRADSAVLCGADTIFKLQNVRHVRNFCVCSIRLETL